MEERKERRSIKNEKIKKRERRKDCLKISQTLKRQDISFHAAL